MSEENTTSSLPAKDAQSDGLTDQQRVFVQEYLTDFNATQAAIRAGYSENSAHSCGPRLLGHAGVSRAIRAAVAERTQMLGIDANDILLRALKVYDMATKAEPVMKWNGEEMVETGEYVFDSKGATKALELIGKLLGAFMKDSKGDDTRPFIIQINREPAQPKTIDHRAKPAGISLPVINVTVKDETE